MCRLSCAFQAIVSVTSPLTKLNGSRDCELSLTRNAFLQFTVDEIDRIFCKRQCRYRRWSWKKAYLGCSVSKSPLLLYFFKKDPTNIMAWNFYRMFFTMRLKSYEVFKKWRLKVLHVEYTVYGTKSATPQIEIYAFLQSQYRYTTGWLKNIYEPLQNLRKTSKHIRCFNVQWVNFRWLEWKLATSILSAIVTGRG